MTKLITTIVAAGLLAFPAAAQSVEDVLGAVLENNLELKALEQSLEAQQDAALAEAALPDLDLEFGYLFGPDDVRRHDFSVSQSFDIATLSGSRHRNVKSAAEVLRYEWRCARKDLLVEARDAYYNIVHLNALIREYEARLESARMLKEGYARGMEEGEFSVIDYRKAALSYIAVESSLKQLHVEREGLMAGLRNMNGGVDIEVNSYTQERILLPASFEDWFDNACEESSSLAYVRAATSASEQNLKLARTELLPSLSVGYMAEVLPGEAFRGVTLGVSVPLWSSGKRISSAKRELEAARIAEQQTMKELEIMAHTLYDKAVAMAGTLADYDAVLAEGDFRAELEQALESGHISLHEYLGELDYWYEAREAALSAELDYMLAVSELLALEI